MGAFGAICQIERRTAVKEKVSAAQAVTSNEHPLSPRVQEALGELVGVAQEGLLALSVGISSVSSPS